MDCGEKKVACPAPSQCLDGPSGAYLETDFHCCGDKHDYSYDSKSSLGKIHIQGRAATCHWKLDALKEFTAPNPNRRAEPLLNYICVQEDSTKPYCKLGPVTGYCQWTEEADKCGGPYCQDMAMTVRGSVYATLAYSKERSNTLQSPSINDGCYKLVDAFNTINDMVLPTKTATPFTEQARSPPCDLTSPGCITELFFIALAQASNSVLGSLFNTATSAYRQCRRIDDMFPFRDQTGQTDHPADYEYKHDGMYAGVALMVMGETSISSLKSPLKVEETGHIEFTPLFTNRCATKIPAEENWPTIRGGASKFWFKEEHKGHPKHSS